MRHFAIVLGVFLAVLAGCVSRPGRDASTLVNETELCRCVKPTRIIGPTAGGTGIPLGNHLILTARHVIKDRFLQIDGRWTRYRVLATGEGPNDDWILIRAAAAPKESSVQLTTGYEPRVGEPLYFLGYWQGQREEPVEIAEAGKLPLCIVRGSAARAPVSFSLPTAGLLFAAAPLSGTSYQGISGGPVAVYDAQKGRYLVVGIYKGSWESSFLGITRTLHTAVLIPEEAITAAAAAPTDSPRGGRR